jgi:ribose transport system permease protein
MTSATVASPGHRLVRSIPLSNLAILGVLVAIFVVFWIISPGHAFASVLSLQAMAAAGSETLILAVGATFVLITGELDLSIGSIVVLSGAIAVKVMAAEAGLIGPISAIVLGIAAGMGIGILVGLVNGLITTLLNVPSFVTTLAMFGIALGVAQLITTGSMSTTVPYQLVTNVGNSNLLGVPRPAIIALVITLVAGYVLAKTRFGAHCAAIGSNRASAIRAGVRVNRVRVAVFVLMGFLASVTAVIDVSRFTTMNLASHQLDALEAISAVIIGGTSLFGGRGSIGGTFIGTLIPIVLIEGLVIQGVEPFWQNIAIGIILIAAVAIDQAQRARLALASTRWDAAQLLAEQELDEIPTELPLSPPTTKDLATSQVDD